MDADRERLLEPGKAYEEYYRERFAENARALFDELVKTSGIDADENRRMAAEYRRADTEAKACGKRLRRLKTWRVILILLAILGVGLAIAKPLPAVIALSLGVSLLALVLLFAVLRPRIKQGDEAYQTAEAQATTCYENAMALVAPLFDYFDSAMTTELIKKTVPLLLFDKNFDMKRYDYLSGKYQYAEDDGEEISTVGVMSGEIIGNPFVFERKLNHRMGEETYTGSLTIHWTTYERDSNGKMVTRHHSQTLHASVKKPKPFYTYTTQLVYGNEAAPDLTFSRTPTHAEQFSSGKLKSYVKTKTRTIKRMSKRKVEQGFTELGNAEFDALFGALDRDHEVQFRLLFTPLAQKNLLSLMKGTQSPYGDDFSVEKRRCINVISSEHAQSWNFNLDSSQYMSYDVDICRDTFLTLNEDYFKSVYFDFAPLLSIPLYQQIKPHDYIYRASYERNYTVREAEVMANRLGKDALAHPASVTPAILKTRLIGCDRDIDTLSVDAYSYRTVERVDYVPKLGGDGRIHDVPVRWQLYIPLEKETQIELRSLALSEREYRHSPYAADGASHTFYHSIFATLGQVCRLYDSAPEEKDADLSHLEEETDAGEAASSADEEEPNT